MIGPEGATALLAARIEGAMPAKLLELHDRLDLPAGTIPSIALVLPRDEYDLALDDYPAVLVVAQEVRTFRQVDLIETGEAAYLVRYAVRVYLWARGEDAAGTDLVRKRLTLALREVLLARGLLGEDGRIEATTLIESYSDVAVDERLHATVAAAYLGVDVVLEEEIREPGLYNIAGDINVGLIPVHDLDAL